MAVKTGRKEVARILRTLDVDAALPRFRTLGFPQARREDGSKADEREVCLAGIHKARLARETSKVTTAAQKEESRQWLRRHGYAVPGEMPHSPPPFIQ